VHTVADFAAYQPEWVKPIAKDYRGYTLHEIPPNGQGIAALMALGILEHFDVASLPVDGTASFHLQIEAMKLAFADVYRYVSEPSTMELSAEQLLDDAYLASRARLIDAKRAQDFGAGNPVKGGTIYLSAADESGMMVSFIQSNYMGFGSGVVIPGWGLSLQNRGHGFSLEPGSPNLVAPGKRPFHTIIPAFVTKRSVESAASPPLPPQGVGSHGNAVPCAAVQPVMSFGVMGGDMQPQGHLQTLVRMLDYRQNPQAACDAPRWRFNLQRRVNLEDGVRPDTVQGLADLGHALDTLNDSYQDFGAGQFIWRLDEGRGDAAVEGYAAASDARRDGLVAGF
jgi:gamma-glutamyltranspeptidase/glutathione hydrolase